MQYYDIKLRLAGSAMNEISKNVSAPEILILQYLHGSDAVINIKHDRVCKKTTNSSEKQRLKAVYDSALNKLDQTIDLIFGALGTLPTEIPEEIAEKYGAPQMVAQISDAAPAKRGRKSKATKAAEELNKTLPADKVHMDDVATG